MNEETFELFGEKLPLYQDCLRCQKQLACRFSGYIYEQPCKQCKASEAYELEMAEKEREKQKMGITQVMANRLPVAVHEFRGTYLYTNRKGDIIKEEKVRPMQQGEKWKK